MAKAKRRRSRSANLTVTEDTYLPGIIKKLRKLTKTEVKIGVSGDKETAMIAAIHEFGSMKAGIPARPVVGGGKKKAQAAISKLAKSGTNEIILKNETAEGLLKKIGQLGQERMVKNLDKMRTPPLSARYAKRKGNKKLLIQDRKLRDSITFVLVSKKGR